MSVGSSGLLAVVSVGWKKSDFLQEDLPEIGLFPKPLNLTLQSRDATQNDVHVVLRRFPGHLQQDACHEAHKLSREVIILFLKRDTANTIHHSSAVRAIAKSKGFASEDENPVENSGVQI